ncbi:thiol:disulfide interchange protein DsbA/DsbL [Lysobacter sp. 5GHs7-4]|uniref:thiol:disulfide interchange protein DsbA/DsbL n=1 Tax=Lysobacter sp. 5GHs7-4 TaxID=2904253 RepID=UPI001E4D1647|nr:thiol:disulfide interchange protein DsbA/DsbL [Lysobacter sp. 5GHs7-4]UHQ23752.1 thiol:disulfide interchange protein DsbA/DsbL [Lysobacter sp. 5GHs7-4]
MPQTRLALLLLALLTLGACKPAADTTPAASTPAATESAPVADEPAIADEPAATGKPTAAPAAADQAAATPAAAAAAPQGLVKGTDYELIDGGQPFTPVPGKIEVVEVFGYVCPACAQFQPMVNAWKAKQAADVHFTYVPAPFGPEWEPYARAYYVADKQGLVARSHDALIRAIHLEQSMPGEGDKPDDVAIGRFYGRYGADPQQFVAAMNSFATVTQVNRGKQFMMRSGVSQTPTLIVNGKYRVIGTTFEDMLRITDLLVAQERAAAPAR